MRVAKLHFTCRIYFVGNFDLSKKLCRNIPPSLYLPRYTSRRSIYCRSQDLHASPAYCSVSTVFLERPAAFFSTDGSFSFAGFFFSAAAFFFSAGFF